MNRKTGRHTEAEALAFPPEASRLGKFKVTALCDGFFDLPASYFLGIEFGEGETVPDSFHIDVNAFLIETPERTLLVDTGCGTVLGPTVNRLPEALRKAGVEPSRIDAILCTHIHPDHTNGLVDADGAPRFPKAEVVVQQDEFAFWLSEENFARAEGEMKSFFEMARTAFKPYSDRVRTFSGGEEVSPGIVTQPLFGHTPGHSGYLIDGGPNAQMLIWGDCVHAVEMQTRRPEIAFAADADKDAACRTRHRLFDQAASDGLIVAGMHVAYPGFGRVKRMANTYAFEPSRSSSPS